MDGTLKRSEQHMTDRTVGTGLDLDCVDLLKPQLRFPRDGKHAYSKRNISTCASVKGSVRIDSGESRCRRAGAVSKNGNGLCRMRRVKGHMIGASGVSACCVVGVTTSYRERVQ